ncbi:hypothetical protein EUX98_g5783 [Antrodiella citrinella]|uniref:Uncharacterized protein n=1 Tax=Antrodiella citrinella TaxID=2447956 RepID=A0A4S4MYC0_9APHY|nr:hypothetical protein EUX98_g5783 [Antrodiella citrinella]
MFDDLLIFDKTYDDYSVLTPVLHCFYEVIRIYPPAWITMRQTETDSVLRAPRLTPTSDVLHVPKGTIVVMDTIGALSNIEYHI